MLTLWAVLAVFTLTFVEGDIFLVHTFICMEFHVPGPMTTQDYFLGGTSLYRTMLVDCTTSSLTSEN